MPYFLGRENQIASWVMMGGFVEEGSKGGGLGRGGLGGEVRRASNVGGSGGGERVRLVRIWRELEEREKEEQRVSVLVLSRTARAGVSRLPLRRVLAGAVEVEVKIGQAAIRLVASSSLAGANPSFFYQLIQLACPPRRRAYSVEKTRYQLDPKSNNQKLSEKWTSPSLSLLSFSASE